MYRRLSHLGEPKNPAVVQSARQHVSVVSSWPWRPQGFLESFGFSVYVGISKKLVLIFVDGFVLLRQGFPMLPWQTWNSLCKPRWPQTHKYSASSVMWLKALCHLAGMGVFCFVDGISSCSPGYLPSPRELLPEPGSATTQSLSHLSIPFVFFKQGSCLYLKLAWTFWQFPALASQMLGLQVCAITPNSALKNFPDWLNHR